ncbi:defensin Lucifensin-like [Anastrepha ludens]|uniref:defensin Lucifensin-like n=1 Tax=Anastrepha ludens TaxID=28586 RepID=UPI0023B00FA0|nr:defensin Lucifensin-like [Anastrepha ludens]
MKVIVFFAGLICAFCLFRGTQAAPADLAVFEPDQVQLVLLKEDPLVEELTRPKRATCDLLSGFGVKHGACAAHCLLRGNRGGYCNGRGVCVCRN